MRVRERNGKRDEPTAAPWAFRRIRASRFQNAHGAAVGFSDFTLDKT
jgi:hypothetical protein